MKEDVTLENFKSTYDPDLVQLGLKWYLSGRVKDIKETSRGHWEALVKDDELEAVSIMLNGGEIQDAVCSCSEFDEEELCSHCMGLLQAITANKTRLSRTEILNIARLSRGIGQKSAQELKTGHQGAAIEQGKNPAMEKPSSVEAFLQYYDKLADHEKEMAMIIALSWRFSVVELLELFKSLRPHYHTDASQDGVTSLLKNLQKSGFLKINGSGKCDMEHELGLQICFKELAGNPRAKEWAELIYQVQMKRYYYIGTGIASFGLLRTAVFLNKPTEAISAMETYIRYTNHGERDILEYWFPDGGKGLERIGQLQPEVRGVLVGHRLQRAAFGMSIDESFINAVAASIVSPSEQNSQLLVYLAEIRRMQGQHHEAKAFGAAIQDPILRLSYQAINAFFDGNADVACQLFEEANKANRKAKRSYKSYLQNWSALYWCLALFKQNNPANYNIISSIIEFNQRQSVSEGAFHHAFYAYRALLNYLENDKRTAIEQVKRQFSSSVMGQLLQLVAATIIDKDILSKQVWEEFRQKSVKLGLHWFVAELDAIYADDSEQLAQQYPTPLVLLLPKVEEWDLALSALLAIGQVHAPKESAKMNDTRLVWFIDFDQKEVYAKEQTFGKKGWTVGKAVSDTRLFNSEIKGMTEQDRRAAKKMFTGSSYYQYRDYDWSKYLPELVGHPMLFLSKSPEVSVHLEKQEPVLVAQPSPSGKYLLRFEPPIEKEGMTVVKETPTRYKVVVAHEEHARIAAAFNGKTLEVPEEGFEKLSEAVSKLGNVVTVRSDMALANEELAEVQPDARPCVHLLPVGEGFHVELYTKPFGTVPPYNKAGEGNETIIGLIDGVRTRTQRNLKAEKKNTKALIQALKVLNENEPNAGVWELEDREQCLDFLSDLHPMVKEQTVILEWPKGEKFKLGNVIGFDKFKISITKADQWFEVSGELRIDEDRVLDLQDLLTLSEQQKTPYIEISPGQFLALTADFRKKLKGMKGLMSKGKKGTLQLHPLAAAALTDFADSVPNAKIDAAFAESREKIKTAFAKKFKLPKKFNAELRPYQLEGFEWLHRLSEWGVGACLADDMGLGKTVQALAFLTDRAALGPALVVAPVSVCYNWVKEIARFAPMLTPVLFRDGDRATTIKSAGKGDLVIATYDLLSRETDLFIEKKWATVVLDEAQAIKNRATKRSETAMQLQAGFKVIMSGTPVENHLGELWNLFQFINPGLLGSIDQFSERFMIPIEKYKDADRRDNLRRLVQPFILRRKKSDVLKDLPAKTEITLQVELSTEERNFYEALRRKAVQNLESETDGNEGERHLRILAEIMKLRRAACHPKLADPNFAQLESGKLRLFGEIVDELLENGHKALVFSQFVAHLAILQDYLKSKNIHYQYLDGQTPQAKRQVAIDQFQAGNGDLFLISLKAGGTGLNLTAADYVLHMDPWWNPAVEDQATDRAHRIGQLKPVTVYRLVATNTIEEKIIQLHEHKRDLADSLLAGTGESARLSADQLLDLLREK